MTLLLANMIVNETLPVIADPVLGGGFQSVVVSTILIVMYVLFLPEPNTFFNLFSFAEIIPQSVCTRHGLLLGAKMAGVTKCLIYGLVSFYGVDGFFQFVLRVHLLRVLYLGPLQKFSNRSSGSIMVSSTGALVSLSLQPDDAFIMRLHCLELKELIAMHDSLEAHGGDLKTDTVTIIGATLDLQEKVVRQASFGPRRHRIHS